ncbi:MAG: abgB [Paenibacillus sp.]|nr:abgB [Paenibacillus sp.]
MGNERLIGEIVESKRDLFIQVSDRIWNYAETRFEEYESAELLCATLESEGFAVERGAGGISTAFVASYGSGKPIVAILGEYDALSGLSQKGGVTYKEPVEAGGKGHGCGHNLLGTGALAAAVALRSYMEENRIPGTVRYYGCPAEEGGGGKAFMARAGLFDDVDFALTWHPYDTNEVFSSHILAACQVYFHFKGRSSHAALSPHLGRSALDAVELMNVGANYLREHMVPGSRLHYAITNAGGVSPNVVQPEAEVLYMLRTLEAADLRDLYKRVCDIARGAALMTETQLDIGFDAGSSNLILNQTLESVMYENLQKLGIPAYDEQEKQFAREIRATLTEAERNNYRYPEMKGKDLPDTIPTYKYKAGIHNASTDLGDVSWIVPTAQYRGATRSMGTPAHSWQEVAHGTTSIAHKGMLHAGKVLALTALEVMQKPHIIEQAKAELLETLQGQTYQCPIPPEVKPSPARKM